MNLRTKNLFIKLSQCLKKLEVCTSFSRHGHLREKYNVLILVLFYMDGLFWMYINIEYLPPFHICKFTRFSINCSFGWFQCLKNLE